MGEREPLVGGRTYGREISTNGNDLQNIADRATQFNNEIAQLSRIADQIGGARDSQTLRNQLQEKREECAATAKITLQLLKKIKVVGPEKVKYDKLVMQINDLFSRYQRISQDSIQRERVTPLVNSSSSLSSVSTPQNGYQSRTNNDRNEKYPDIDIEEQQRAQRQLQSTSYAVDKAIIDEREQDFRHLEKELTGLNEMMIDISQMVREQGEDIITIGDNTSNANIRVEEGVKELQKASEYQKSSRKKLCCLVLILVLVLGGVGIFLAIFFGAVKK